MCWLAEKWDKLTDCCCNRALSGVRCMSFAIGHAMGRQDTIWHAMGSSDDVCLQSEVVSDIVWHALGVVDGVGMQSKPLSVVVRSLRLSIGGCAVIGVEDLCRFASVQSLFSRAIFLPGERKICQDCEFFAGEAKVIDKVIPRLAKNTHNSTIKHIKRETYASLQQEQQ